MKILIISPLFLPDMGVGSLRMSSLAKFLLKKNYIVDLLTTKKDGEIPVDCVNDFYEVEEFSGNGDSAFARYNQFKENQSRYIQTFLKIIGDKEYSLILITGGPFYTMAISKIAKKRNIPCILDFRDPWTFDIRGLDDLLSPKRIITRAMFLPMERSAVQSASAIVTVTPRWVDMFKTLYPCRKSKVYLVENGYDDERLANISIKSDEKISRGFDSTIQIAVFGKLFYYSEHYSKVFLSALEKCWSDFKILQIGDRENVTDCYLNSFNLDVDVVKSTGFMEYEEGVKTLSTADAFLIIDSRKGALGTKLYDYIYIDKPIIFVGPKKSSFADIIAQLPNGYVCSTKEEVLYAFATLKNEKTKSEYRNKDVLKYARSVQNQKYMQLIENIIKKKD
jgi:glycosyltransferase involved in cell wall biosynthesis